MPTLSSLLSWSKCRSDHHPPLGKKRPSLKRDRWSFCRNDAATAGLETIYQPDIDEMKRVFRKFDANNDGRISADELEHVLERLGNTNNLKSEVRKMIQAADTNSDDFIDFREFMDVHTKDGGIRDAEIRSAFTKFDLDGNGRISEEELYTVLTRLGEHYSLEECRKMVTAVDTDGDGLVDMQDFVTMMTKTTKLVES